MDSTGDGGRPERRDEGVCRERVRGCSGISLKGLGGMRGDSCSWNCELLKDIAASLSASDEIVERVKSDLGDDGRRRRRGGHGSGSAGPIGRCGGYGEGNDVLAGTGLGTSGTGVGGAGVGGAGSGGVGGADAGEVGAGAGATGETGAGGAVVVAVTGTFWRRLFRRNSPSMSLLIGTSGVREERRPLAMH